MIAGGAKGSADLIRTWPRLSGRRLHTDAVKAGKGWSGSPNFSSDSGCTWYSRFGVSREGSDLAKAPSWLGDMVIGPRRNRAYSSPMPTRPSRLLARSLIVLVLRTLKARRTCKWSCRLSPTPGSAWTMGMPCSCSTSPGPTPESCRSWGEATAPAARITSRRAVTLISAPSRRSSTPTARRPSNRMRLAWALVSTSRLGRSITGRRKPFAVVQRTPRVWLTWK